MTAFVKYKGNNDVKAAVQLIADRQSKVMTIFQANEVT